MQQAVDGRQGRRPCDRLRHMGRRQRPAEDLSRHGLQHEAVHRRAGAGDIAADPLPEQEQPAQVGAPSAAGREFRHRAPGPAEPEPVRGASTRCSGRRRPARRRRSSAVAAGVGRRWRRRRRAEGSLTAGQAGRGGCPGPGAARNARLKLSITSGSASRSSSTAASSQSRSSRADRRSGGGSQPRVRRRRSALSARATSASGKPSGRLSSSAAKPSWPISVAEPHQIGSPDRQEAALDPSTATMRDEPHRRTVRPGGPSHGGHQRVRTRPVGVEPAGRPSQGPAVSRAPAAGRPSPAPSDR